VGVVSHAIDLVEHTELLASSRSLKSSARKTSSPAPGLGGRVHPQIARAKLRALRNGAATRARVGELN
jgi:5-methyltetrahydropteroyltriglutamate--homocysteine methyltransferase